MLGKKKKVKSAGQVSSASGAKESEDSVEEKPALEHEGVKQREPFKVDGRVAAEREMKVLWKTWGRV